ncbi:MAG: hypothetical protein JO353_03010, partial [Phycisphaerae bacterium]|nr:hypothetical protein [Phycisphaerae bacterium]
MVALRDIHLRPSDVLEEAKHVLGYTTQKPMRTGSILIILLLAAGLYWMLPEIRRYLRI